MPYSLNFHGEALILRPSGALYWPARRVLCVSDLHLGKSERLARRGGALLPPYETRETLARLDAEIEATGATTILCLGDSFDDAASLNGLEEADLLWLSKMTAGRTWIWIIGNHDAGPLEIAGTHLATFKLGPITFRHIADPSRAGEISGHYHPKARLAGKAWRCFLVDGARMILPAFGTYTGGLWCHDPVLADLMQPQALALLCGQSVRAIPMPRASTSGR